MGFVLLDAPMFNRRLTYLRVMPGRTRPQLSCELGSIETSLFPRTFLYLTSPARLLLCSMRAPFQLASLFSTDAECHRSHEACGHRQDGKYLDA
jgi:hypothetical protein